MNILLRNKIIFTFDQFSKFLKLNFIFCNGVAIQNIHFIATHNDKIQCIFLKKYFIFRQYFKQFYIKKIGKIRYLLKQSRLNQFNFYKQKKYTNPS